MLGHRTTLISILYLLLFVWLFIGSCKQTFEPLQENDQYYFSIYGYLDATADTQWVRVMPVREDLFLEPRPIDATVRLEDLDGGGSVVMEDSLFEYAHGVYAYNFWTTMPVHPEHSYRLTAEREDGNFSRTVVTLPADFPIPWISIEYLSSRNPVPIKTTVYVEGVERLADVQTLYNDLSIAHLSDTLEKRADQILVVIDPRDDFQELNLFFPETTLLSFLGPSAPYDPKIYVAAAGPDFYNFGPVDDKIIALPGGVSNIENGVGYLGGIVSKTIPHDSCTKPGTSIIIPCSEVPPPW